MKKRILLNFLQYLFAVLLIGLTVVYIYAFENNFLPLMNEDYLYLKSEGMQQAESEPPIPDGGEEEEIIITADSFVSSLPVYGSSLFGGVYSSVDCRLVNIPMSSMGTLSDSILQLYMGYVYKTDRLDGGVSVYSGKEGLKDISDLLDNAKLQLIRDKEGRPLFYKDSAYYYYENGKLHSAEYDSANYDKGVGYYPSYEAGSNGNYSAFTENGCWGMKSADGRVIVPAIYKDVYGESEGRIIAIGASGGVYVYDTEGKLLTGFEAKYKIDLENESDISYEGCFFYQNGLTRVYKENGKSVLIDKNGKEQFLPNGFDLVAYSDGVAVLKQSYKDDKDSTYSLYGYMNYSGEWINTPDYLHAEPFYEGLAAVCGKDGKWGMIDKTGNVVIPMVFDSISDCQDGVILAYEQKYGNCVIGKALK